MNDIENIMRAAIKSANRLGPQESKPDIIMMFGVAFHRDGRITQMDCVTPVPPQEAAEASNRLWELYRGTIENHSR